MHRYYIEYRLRRQSTNCILTLMDEGIDGGPHKRWSMWFNSMIREEPYQGLNVSCMI
jgi:hypothetical protein